MCVPSKITTNRQKEHSENTKSYKATVYRVTDRWDKQTDYGAKNLKKCVCSCQIDLLRKTESNDNQYWRALLGHGT